MWVPLLPLTRSGIQCHMPQVDKHSFCLPMQMQQLMSVTQEALHDRVAVNAIRFTSSCCSVLAPHLHCLQNT
jgi:hypothetical protein